MKFKIVQLGKKWTVIKIGEVLSEKYIRDGFSDDTKNWDGSLTHLNEIFSPRNYYKDLHIKFEEEATTINKKQLALQAIKSLTLQEASEIGISTETYENLTKKDELIWKPEIGEKYYCVTYSGDVWSCSWDNDSTDLFRQSNANIFKTPEEAEKYLNYINSQDEINKTFKWIERYVALNDDGWKADWDDEDQYKYYLMYNLEHKNWYISYNLCFKTNLTTYISENTAKKLVEVLNK